MRTIALRHGIIIPSSPIGKTKMGLEVTAIIFLIIELLPPIGTILIWAAMIVSLISAVDYFKNFSRELN